MCVQSFMIIQNVLVKTTVNCLRLFVVVYKLVNLICRCGVTVVVYYTCTQFFMLIHYSKGIR